MSGAPGWALGLPRWAAELGRDLQRPIRACGGPDPLWSREAPGLAAVLRVPDAVAASLVALRREQRVDGVLAELAARGIGHLWRGGPGWPAALDDLPDPPVALFTRAGSATPLAALADHPVVAVVGSRRATAQGLAMARDVGRRLARRGAVVVSGLAHGIDTAAHEGALEADGITVAVLGCGVDIAYPRRNRALAQRIVERGALLSEFWPGTAPAPWRFPARNRIVAGLSHAVAVIEAGERSGALITADFALEAGRPVLAVPGWPGAASSVGCNGLLRAGAALLEDVDDIVDEVAGAAWAAPEENPGAPPSGVAAQIYRCLTHEPLPADVVAERLGCDAATVAAALAVLEVEGRVVRGQGQRYWAAPAGG